MNNADTQLSQERPIEPEGTAGRTTMASRWWTRHLKTFGPTAAAAVALVLIGQYSEEFRLYEWTLWAAFGVLAASFTFVWGHAGIFSFGQAAFFGIGAYAYGIAGINISPATGETLSALAIGSITAAVVAGLLGYFMFYGQVGDVYVAVITLAVTLVLLTVLSSTASPKYHVGDALIGGYNGMPGIPPVMVGGFRSLDTREMFLFSAFVALLTTLGLHVLRNRPFGRVVAAVRENELRAQLLGFDVRRYKLGAFVVGGGVAGLAGGLYAAWGMFVSPNVFNLSQAALVAIWVLVGGRTSLVGAFVGVAIVQGMSTSLGGSGGQWTPIVLGAVLIAMVLLLPEGVVPTLYKLAGRVDSLRRGSRGTRRTPAGNVAADSGGNEVGADGRRQLLEQVFSVRSSHGEPKSIAGIGLVKQFGGVRALAGADIAVEAGQVHALIGPNGAGKSTCFNLLTGRYAPTEGRILLGSVDVTKHRPDARARAGLGVKLQVASYFAQLDVRENLWLAAFAQLRTSHEADDQAARVVTWLGIADRSAAPAATLSHGQHQWLEIGMVLAGAPAVTLLDEPTAGMTREETSRTVTMIREISRFTTVVTVEHDMEFLRDLDAPVTMFHQGRVFASGSIEDLRRDERVLDTYLGRPVVGNAGD